MSLQKNQNLNKINQIILYSQNYATHKKMLHQIKPCIDSLSPKRYNQHRKLTNQHSRYVQAVQKLKLSQLNQSNQKLKSKLYEISKTFSKLKSPQQKQNQSTSRSLSNLKSSKQRKRFKQKKQISLENIKINQRISKSRFKQNFGRESYYKQKAQTVRDLNIRGEFSQRSHSVIENLVYNDLKIKQADIPFLPLLFCRQKMVSKSTGNNKIPGKSRKKYLKTNFQRESLSFEKDMKFAV